ncbi:hypothetical protein CCYA_CCYA13G3452 [Cyanidiococcus yangmingshanensis]|nr:hypothetical protein CCYA_CCYA13G3452 [Cyanidiococcus yangmingshanensis]
MWCSAFLSRSRQSPKLALRKQRWVRGFGDERLSFASYTLAQSRKRSRLDKRHWDRAICACSVAVERASSSSPSSVDSRDVLLIILLYENVSPSVDESDTRLSLPMLPGVNDQRIGACAQGIACVADLHPRTASETVLEAFKTHIATSSLPSDIRRQEVCLGTSWLRRVTLQTAGEDASYLDEALDALTYFMKCLSFLRTVEALTGVLRSVASQMMRGGDVTILSREPDVVRSLGALLFARTELMKRRAELQGPLLGHEHSRLNQSIFEQLDKQVFHSQERLARLEPDLATLRDGLVLTNSQIEFRISSRIERMILLLLAVEVVFAFADAFF